MRYISLLLTFCIGLFHLSCKKESVTVLQGKSDFFAVPSHFPQPHYQFENNPVTSDGFELGRRLFYETRLSSDYSISCASCHHQSFAFSDAGKIFSSGVEGKIGSRNSPAMFNLAWSPSFMWDGGVNHIEIMPFAPLTDSVEMNMDMNDLLNRLRSYPEYPVMFKKAFGTEEINDQRFFYALTQFMSMMISSNSKYDKFLQGMVEFSPEELNGKLLFEEHCISCHKGVLFTDYSFRNNGLDSSPLDIGRERITQNADDRGKFKVPSLRNVMQTYPYMHDGRFMTIEQVIDHYRFSIQSSANLDPILVGGITLTESEKEDLIQFLHTLTDWDFISDSRFSTPF